MLFNSYLVFCYVFVFVLLYNLARYLRASIHVKNVLILLGNVMLLLTLVREHTLIVMAILSGLVYLVGFLLQKKSRKILLGFLLCLLIVLFSIRNYPYVQNAIEDTMLSFLLAPILSVQKLGLSYILFRFVHFLVECHRHQVHYLNFFAFLNYIFFFPTILAGPIDTYNNFRYWLGRKATAFDRSLFFAGITRVFIGALKTLAIVPLIIHYATDYTSLTPDYGLYGGLALSLLAYSAYIYIDFSGYSDIAIGTAFLIGIKTPENFRNPYFSVDLSAFWRRWHITFSLFLRRYVFKPSLQLYNSFFNLKKNRLLVTVLCYLTTFTICGLWHGDTLNFVYWGLWHGAGLSVNKLWKVYIANRLHFRFGKPYKVASGIITFLYVSLGWMFFHYSNDELLLIFSAL